VIFIVLVSKSASAIGLDYTCTTYKSLALLLFPQLLRVISAALIRLLRPPLPLLVSHHHKRYDTMASPSLFSSSSTAAVSLTAKPVGTKTIEWDGELYEFSEPRWCSREDECLANFDAKVKIDQAIANSSDFPEEQRKLQELREPPREFLSQQHANKGAWKLQLRNLDDNDGGLYLVVYRKRQNQGVVSWQFKFGMSAHCFDRVMEQPHSFAARVMTMEEIREMVPVTLVELVKSKELPALVFHEDHESYTEDFIRMQLCEMVHACCRDCSTNTVCERLVELPSLKVREAVAERTDFLPEHIEFMRGIEDGAVKTQLSWPTLP